MKREATKKKLEFFNVCDFVKTLTGTEYDPKLENIPSTLLTTPLLTTPTGSRLSGFGTEADLHSYVTVAMWDASRVCNNLFVPIAKHLKNDKPPDLVVRQEVSIFSNRPDHIVLFDRTSNAPVLCVEVKKPFREEQFAFDIPNHLCGQLHDQLRALKGMGNSCPIGAITTFNNTYFTMLESNFDWNVPHTIESLKSLLGRFPTTMANDKTPSPLEVKKSSNMKAGHPFLPSFKQDENCSLIISEQSVDQSKLVSALVGLMLHALAATLKPPPVEKFYKGQLVSVDTIRMSPDAYVWGNLRTKYKGCLKNRHADDDLYLMRCIGTGSTSTAYHAISKKGYDCVVKIYVQDFNEDEGKKSTRKSKKDSDFHVTNEVSNYSKIYGNELCDYVWKRKVNKMDCVIMPFFEPISKEERLDENVLESIDARLQLVAGKQLAFLDPDYSWRHIGRFDGKIFLFDLGDMATCKSVKKAKKLAEEHLNVLLAKASNSQPPP